VPAAANVEHGQYLATMCMGCHGPRFAGGRIPGSPPAWPPAPNLTPGPVSGMAAYDTPAKFAAMMREGRRPDGTAVNSIMPFEALSQLNDVDLQGLYAYLRTLPAITEGRR
jgi:cytochrome c553